MWTDSLPLAFASLLSSTQGPPHPSSAISQVAGNIILQTVAARSLPSAERKLLALLRAGRIFQAKMASIDPSGLFFRKDINVFR